MAASRRSTRRALSAPRQGAKNMRKICKRKLTPAELGGKLQGKGREIDCPLPRQNGRVAGAKSESGLAATNILLMTAAKSYLAHSPKASHPMTPADLEARHTSTEGNDMARKPKDTKSYVVEKKFGDRGFATWEDGDMQITVEDAEGN